ncbi:hypothetical protein MSPP1_001604 [Malassezia sp. CBS 17886]|nr:hypothetical protein MSPP1_001604 [Malassezia sp. CBS 17886]
MQEQRRSGEQRRSKEQCADRRKEESDLAAGPSPPGAALVDGVGMHSRSIQSGGPFRSTATDCASPTLPPLRPEEDEGGNVEYKYQILPTTADRLDRLVTQLSWRLTEGEGTCIYEVGAMDDGTLAGLPLDDLTQSLAYLCAMATHLGAQATLQRLVGVVRSQSDASVHVVTQESEARALLHLDDGLPLPPTIPQLPRDALALDLAKPRAASAPYCSVSAPSAPPTPARRRMQSRQLHRLARFEAAVRAGAGVLHTTDAAMHTPCDTPNTVPLRMGTVYDRATAPSPDTRWLAEVAVQQDHGFFVDYTSL